MSAIEWTSETWNPLVGCTKVSAGCKGCYAIRQAWRNAHMPHTAERYAGTVAKTSSGLNWTGQVKLVESVLDKPLRWRKARRVFVNSMSDLFHESVRDADIYRIFGIMAAASQHTFQVLTKRPERMRDFMRNHWGILVAKSDVDPQPGDEPLAHAAFPLPLPNVWLGVSVEDQATADARIPLLLETPAAVRFVSAEPLLGPVGLRHLQPRDPPVEIDALGGTHGVLRPHGGTNDRLDWVIVGGESGPGARPCDVEWIRSIVRQCRDAGVPAFVKQLGAYSMGRYCADCDDMDAPCWNGDERRCSCRCHLRDRKGGDPAEWPEDLRVREFPKAEKGGRP